eukprot:TRINITY_DN22092_c0_g2_i1.p1 TRINITY_DN22092_c0_g2~~TRINITY_DN22092_c0_g2_i1.p1  ORF type:complete len:475 (-),score=51.84 TRINITY_DN22092_c0_g2_i1:52-1476(-)
MALALEKQEEQDNTRGARVLSFEDEKGDKRASRNSSPVNVEERKVKQRKTTFSLPEASETQEQSGPQRSGRNGNPDHHDGTIEEEPTKTLVWEPRGSAIGIVMEISTTYGFYSFLLLNLMLGLNHFKAVLMPCDSGHYGGIRSYVEICFCEYCKSFIDAFPSVASSVLLLLLGRDLVQKRLYYGILKAGGVIEYEHTSALKDPYMIMLIINYVHCIAYVVQTSHLLTRLVGLSHTALQGSGPSISFQVHYVLVSVVVLFPVTLIFIFLYGAYNIHLTLVPLSEFVQDNMAHKLLKLRVLKEGVLRDLVDPKEDVLGVVWDVAQLTGRADRCKFMVKEYEKEVLRDPQAEQEGRACFSGLWSSLWPSPIVMAGIQESTGDGVHRFRFLWLCFLAVSLGMLFYEAVVLGSSIWGDVLAVIDGHARKLLGLFVTLVHFIVVCCSIWGIVRLAVFRPSAWKRAVLSRHSTIVANSPKH